MIRRKVIIPLFVALVMGLATYVVLWPWALWPWGGCRPWVHVTAVIVAAHGWWGAQTARGG